MTDFIDALARIVGKRHVLTGDMATRSYRTGYREGGGMAAAVVRPANLRQLWAVAQACISAGKIIITQAANTGLTGGSTPDGTYDRDVLIINTMRIDAIRPINHATQVVCHAGATLYGLEALLRPAGREPHSVIGSSCIGASVVGGVCNNSGGALIRRGPAYTECAVFARLSANGELELVNHLGIDLGDTADEILRRLDDNAYAADGHAPAGAASDPDYGQHVRAIDAPTPARFNADPRRLHEASGCAGRLIVFAVRLDTFPAHTQRSCFYIGTKDTALLTDLRRSLLRDLPALPVSAEYMHRDAYDIAEAYGRDTFWIIYKMGTAFLPLFFRWKGWLDAITARLGIRHGTDRLLQSIASLLPQHLPQRLQDFRTRYDHYLLLDVTADTAVHVQTWLETHLAEPHGGWFACTADEARRAQLHRFVAAGAAIRYSAVHYKSTGGLVALDVALRRNDRDWMESLPPALAQSIALKLYYGHFFCHVFHQDYVLHKDIDPAYVKSSLLSCMDQRGAEYPAEHNVGHAYAAKAPLQAFYRTLDPCNALNPGIGKTSKKANWR